MATPKLPNEKTRHPRKKCQICKEVRRLKLDPKTEKLLCISCALESRGLK